MQEDKRCSLGLLHFCSFGGAAERRKSQDDAAEAASI